MKKAILVVLFLAATAFFANAYTNDENEELRLNDLRDDALKQCHGDVPCRQAVKKKYEAAGYLLRTDPDKYWSRSGGTVDRKQKQKGARSGEGLSQNSTRKSNDNQNKPVNISGKFDAQGRYYSPAGGGNLVRTTDGTFMNKVGGGYIDTRSGEFVPGH